LRERVFDITINLDYCRLLIGQKRLGIRYDTAVKAMQKITENNSRLLPSVVPGINIFTSAEEGGYVFGLVCLSLCLFVCLSVGLLANL